MEETNPVAEKASLGNVNMNETVMNNKMPTGEVFSGSKKTEILE